MGIFDGIVGIALIALALWFQKERRALKELRELFSPLLSTQEKIERELADSQKLVLALRSRLLEMEQGWDRERQERELREEERTTQLKALEQLLARLEARSATVEAGWFGEPRSASEPPASEGRTNEGPMTPLAEEVLGLLAAGGKPEEIARQKGLQLGEIMLIRNLSRFGGKGR